MPIKFSSLDTKDLADTAKIVGLWTDASSATGLSNCIIDSSKFAKQTDLNNVDLSAVHIYRTEEIIGDKTFTGKVYINNDLTVTQPISISNTLTTTSTIRGVKADASNSTSETLIPTIGWVNDTNTATNVVHRTSSETMTGSKTFNNNYTYLQSTTIDVANVPAPSSTCTLELQWADKNKTTYGVDYLRTYNNGVMERGLFIRKHSVNEWAGLAIGFDGNDNLYTSAPTMPVTNNSQCIATTAFSQTLLRKFFGKNKPNLHTLYYNSSGLGTGDIPLNESFTKYDMILVFMTNDSNDYMVCTWQPTWLLNYMLTSAPKAVYLALNQGNYWIIQNYANGSSTTYFKERTENSKIFWIYGVNMDGS